jgi:Zn-finger protein
MAPLSKQFLVDRGRCCGNGCLNCPYIPKHTKDVTTLTEGCTKNENYKFFENKKCEYYPCHDMETINCMFCYCPLYALKDCGGQYTMLDNGIKDCTGCTYNHDVNNFDAIMDKLAKIKPVI